MFISKLVELCWSLFFNRTEGGRLYFDLYPRQVCYQLKTHLQASGPGCSGNTNPSCPRLMCRVKPGQAGRSVQKSPLKSTAAGPPHPLTELGSGWSTASSIDLFVLVCDFRESGLLLKALKPHTQTKRLGRLWTSICHIL